MSKITGKQFSETFGLRIVSGMLVSGSVLVSWATGIKASSQMDWGFDSLVPFTTPEYNDEPNEMVRYHQIWFPITYLDTDHFFRVRSRTAAGEVAVSAVYSVFVTEKLAKSSEAISGVELVVKQVTFPVALQQTITGIDSTHRMDADPESSAEIVLASNISKPAVKGGTLAGQTTSFETNITSTIT